MKKKNNPAIISILLCLAMLTACGLSMSPSASTAGSGKEAAADTEQEAADQQEADEPAAQDKGSTANEEADAEEEQSSAMKTENGGAAEVSGDPAEATDLSGQEATDQSGQEDIQALPVGAVVMTGLSSADAMAFDGKKMTANPEYLEQATASDVYYCRLPLSRIEVHPIKQWAKDYSSYTISDEILGEVESTGAEEPFRIFDVYPEGIPANCLVFYLEDGNCGTFSLSFNGSGEQRTWYNEIYKDYASMEVSRAKEMEVGAINWILGQYKELAKKFHNGEGSQDTLRQRLLDGDLPSFGDKTSDYDGNPMYYASECHFDEVCYGTIPSIGITRIDLNHDGTEELIIGDGYADETASESPTTLFAAYSVKGGEVQTVFQGWSRSLYYLAEDGSILHEASNGAVNYEIRRYKLVEDEDGVLSLKETEAVVVDGAEYPEEPYFYYPNGREITGYDEYGAPEYSYEKVLQMDEEKGGEYFRRITREEMHIELEEYDLLEE